MSQSILYLFGERTRVLAEISSLNAQLTYAQANANQAIVAGIEARLASSQELLDAINEQIQQAQQQSALGTASAGQVIAEEQKGNAEKSTTQNPQPFPTAEAAAATVPVFTQNQINQNLETGTNGRLRPVTETQATPAVLPQPFSRDEDGNPLPPTASLSTSPGVGARSDDNTTKNSLSVQQTINANFSQRIDPRPNILDQYASYTYSLTWYLLTPEQYNQMQRQAKKNISNWQILVQSAGAPIAPGNGLPGRNEFFSNDYYLDNLVINTAVAGKGSGGATNATDLNFTITEPNGFTLIENLYRAVSSVYKKNNLIGVYTQAEYCLCIRFYGYNDAGELVQVGKTTNPGGSTPGPTVSTDVRAVVEKFIPFRIVDLKTKIANRAIEYQISGAGIGTSTAFSSQRGSIPFPYELAGSTVGELLNGRPVGTNYTRTDGRTGTGDPPSSSPTSPVNPGNQAAGVDALGNFTGATENPFTVVAP
jgi:hypothetical protein